MNYRYVAYTRHDKKLVKGTIDGASEAVATQLLLNQGYQPITLKQTTTRPPIEEMFPSLFKVKTKDIMTFSRQLATLLDAGVSIIPALLLIQNQISNRLLKKIVADVIKEVRAGSSFSDAISKHNKVFGELYCQVVAVGERTGGAADALRQAAIYMEKDDNIKKKIKKAMTYPAIVLVIATIVIIILTAFVLPRLTNVLKSLDAPMPLSTRILISFTDFMAGHWFMLLGGIALAILVGILYIRRPTGRYQLDQLLLAIPVIGKANLMGEMARFSRTLALLVRVGLPLPQTLEMARRTSGNLVVQNALANVRTALLQGEGLSGPMAKNKVFPPVLVQMVMVGEESGRLSSTLETAAVSYEVEADEKINAMIALIEPVMIITLALIVGFIAISTITPMYSIYGHIK
jgi:type IV pilus assembly protein PilC